MKIKYVIIVFLLILFYSCIKKEVGGVKIGHNLYDTQTKSFNNNLCFLIENSLKKDEESLKKLIKVSCGGASGCYDLGEVIVQVICKIGESDFTSMAVRLNKEDRNELKDLIRVGLEYGSKNFFGVKNLGKLEIQFPELNQALDN
jgi:hypothetical protein